jgi:hypothetical protein
MTEYIKKKRGRKPKNIIQPKQEVLQPIIDESRTDEENIILHLPVTVDDIDNITNNHTVYFIKQSVNNNLIINKDIKEIKEVKETKNNEDSIVNYTENKSMNYININKIMIHTLNINQNTKCWWCHYSFTSVPVQLPDEYYNNTFFCSGHFCSFNCAKSYNLQNNDNLVWRRCSLLNLLYFQTYSEHKDIIPAPSWLVLNDYGGALTIEQFRNNFIFNNKEYIVLHPPLISRQMQIEESYKLNTNQTVSINNLNKIYSELDTEFQLRRAKPIISSQLNLETTMGLTKARKK